MAYRLIFVCAFLLLPACTTESVVDNSAKSNADVKTKPMVPGNTADGATEPVTDADDAKELLESLTAKFEKAQSKWMEQDVQARMDNLGSESRPSQEYAEKLIELAEKYPNTDAAKRAWPIAVKYGLRDAKAKASQAVLAAATVELDPAKSMKDLEFLMEYSMGDPQKEAMELMLSRALEDKDPESAFNIIKKIVSSRLGVEIHGDMIMHPGHPEVRQKAIQQLLAIVDADVKSDKAVECLSLIYENDWGENRDSAVTQLLKHQPAHPKTMEIVRGLGRSPSAKNESLIKQAMSSSDERAKINAVITLSRFYSDKQLTAQHYESSPNEVIKRPENEEYFAYLKTKSDPADLTRLERMLKAYVDTHQRDENDDMLAKAKNELFALQNLAIGKHAPEIVGEDLDGVEFKLSDYRGQIVFLDFWGDW